MQRRHLFLKSASVYVETDTIHKQILS